MTSWLNDTENLMANQKLPSADHKVVKEQLAAQKVNFFDKFDSFLFIAFHFLASAKINRRQTADR